MVDSIAGFGAHPPEMLAARRAEYAAIGAASIQGAGTVAQDQAGFIVEHYFADGKR